MIIETNRLFLREMTENDFEALYKVLSDSDTKVFAISREVWEQILTNTI